MKRLNFLWSFLLAFSYSGVFYTAVFYSAVAKASDLNVSLTTEENKSEISLAFEIASLEVEDEEINSYGARISYNHHLWKQIDVDAFLASTLSGENGIKPGSTTLGLYGMYNIFDSERFEKTVRVNSESLFSEKHQVSRQLRLGIGFEQCFLSGERGVYSAAGPGFQINYEQVFRATKYFVGARMATLRSGDLEVKATMFNMGLFLNF